MDLDAADGPGAKSLGVPAAVAQILDSGGAVAGAGFLIADDLVITCAHVVRDAGQGPNQNVQVVFPHLDGAPGLQAAVLSGPWRAPEAEDIAVLRLCQIPTGARAMSLGSAAHSQGNRVRAFGFPSQAPEGGHFGYGVAGDLLPDTAGAGPLLQLTDANDLTTGFSGGPLVDEVTGRVIGMVTAIAAPDAHLKGLGIAYATPTETVRKAWPQLIVQEISPYRDLEPFATGDARWFHGREVAVERVLASLAGQRRILLLLGPSGSGKSSLVQAGVVPALATGRLPGSDRWLPVLTRPRSDLLTELERAGMAGAAADGIMAAVNRRLAAEPGYHHLLLIIDQFEEVLLQPATEHQLPRGRLAVLEQLIEAVSSPAALSVVLVMRDDFYPRLAAVAPALLESVGPGLLNVPASLSTQDLRAIIARPAQAAGARFEDGLPERIIADVLAADPTGGTTRQAPVTLLPPLELALSQLWERRRDGYLTHDAYQRIGEVSGSLATWCNTALDQLPASERLVAKRILTALVRPADETHHIPAARQQVTLATLRDLAADISGPNSGDQTFDDVLARLAFHRIITTSRTPDGSESESAPSQPVAELIHDALIRDWSRLRDWVAEDHRFHDWLRRANEQHARWVESEHPGDLLNGTDLAEGMDWAEQRRLPKDLAAFLTASREQQQAAVRRTRRINTVLAGLLAMTLIAAGLASWQQQVADAARQKAVDAQQTSLSRQLGVQASSLTDTDPDLASLLAVQSYRVRPTAEAIASLYAAAALPLQRRLIGHTAGVTSVAFSPDGRTLASGSNDGTVRLWEATTGRVRATLHSGNVAAVAFSPDGGDLATGGTDGTVRLWNVATGRASGLARVNSGQRTLVFSRDGRILAAGGEDGTVRLWDAATGHLMARLRDTESVSSIAFSPDGGTLASNSGGALRLWDVATRQQTKLKAHVTSIDLAFSPVSHILATGISRGSVRLWDTSTHHSRTIASGHNDTLRSIAFSPDGRTLATTSDDRTVALLDVQTGEILATLAGHSQIVSSVAFSPNGRSLATGSDDRTVRFWDATVGRAPAAFPVHSGGVTSVAFSSDGHTLATGGQDYTARLWNPATHHERAVLKGSDIVTSVAFSPDGRTLATGRDDGTVKLADVATGLTRRVSLTSPSGGVNSVSFSPDGHTLAGGSPYDGIVWLWNVETGQLRDTVGIHNTRFIGVDAVAFSPDGRALATGDGDGTVRLWEVGTGHLRATLKGHSEEVASLAFSPDGHTLATGSSDHTARLWDLATDRTREIITDQVNDVTSVAFSPDGRTLASGSLDGTVLLWDIASGRKRASLAVSSGGIRSVAFSPNGRALATGSDDGTVRLLTIDLPNPSQAISKICRAVDRDLTQDERSVYLPDQPPSPVCPS